MGLLGRHHLGREAAVRVRQATADHPDLPLPRPGASIRTDPPSFPETHPSFPGDKALLAGATALTRQPCDAGAGYTPATRLDLAGTGWTFELGRAANPGEMSFPATQRAASVNREGEDARCPVRASPSARLLEFPPRNPAPTVLTTGEGTLLVPRLLTPTSRIHARRGYIGATLSSGPKRG